ncbi:Synaptic vesicle 2 protein [Fasciolopsis buskii]|uniref:Synaptic vesicle 2 protein n=1 Tax=Fasciolopsis buskii TaxID=27845 RepID=A0A8E0RIR1_9TREM|nr:Synaptic vesicle 2 protein [Fasciolopsis buski]
MLEAVFTISLFPQSTYQVFWAIGSTFEVGLAYLILPRFGWRWLVFASAVPLVLFLSLLRFLPESPRYLVTANRLSEAEQVVQNMFRVNRIQPLEGRLTTSVVASKNRSRLPELFSKMYRLTTVMLPTIWFGAAFAYYGVVLLSAEIFRFRQECYGVNGPHLPPSEKNLTVAAFQASTVHQVIPHHDSSCCQELNDSDFITMIVSSVGEFVNIPFLILFIDLLGRKITLGIWNGITGLMFFILYICMTRQAMTGVLFGVRAMAAGLLSLSYVYTGEVFPTTVRALAIGIFSSISRLGAMTTPYVAQVMLPEFSEIGALSLYASISLLCAVLAFLLPIETAGRELPIRVPSSVYR